MLSYREASDGQLLEEGITEAGAMASFTAASTAYASWGQPMIPFYIFYSMFGFQRVGDMIWSLGDQRGRGFLLGATAGRTTLSGEGLQHCDGQSQMYALAYPNCRAYDPAFAYEVGVLVRDGIRRMYGPEPEDCFYYLTLYNENYVQPPMPEGVEDGIVRGMYLLAAGGGGAHAPRRRSSRAGRWCCRRSRPSRCSPSTTTSAPTCGACPGWKQLRDDALECERWNRLHPSEPPRTPYVTESARRRRGPDRRGLRLGARRCPTASPGSCPSPTSCSAPTATASPTCAPRCGATSRSTPPTWWSGVLDGLAQTGDVKAETVAEAIERYEIDADAPDPRTA